MRPGQLHRFIAVALGAVTLVGVAILLAWDAFPALFPAGSHAILAASSLALIAVAYLVYQIARRPAPIEFLKAILLAAAFLFWAANQCWPNSPEAALFNDIAIALFVLDIFLVIAGWPRSSASPPLGETCPHSCSGCCAASRGEERRCAGPISAG